MPSKRKEEEKEEGLGKFEFSDGSFYEGHYIVKRDLVEGVVQSTTGPVVRGSKSGPSTQTASESAPTVPLLQNGLGVYQDGSGSLYDGQWLEGKPSGTGTLSFSSGGRYTGCFLEGRYHGLGRYIWSDGSYYEGEWAANVMNGTGIFVDVHGQRWHGKFLNGEGNNLYTELIV